MVDVVGNQTWYDDQHSRGHDGRFVTMPPHRAPAEQMERLRQQASPDELDAINGHRWRQPGDRYVCGQFVADLTPSSITQDGRDVPPGEEGELMLVVSRTPTPSEPGWESRDEHGEAETGVEIVTGLPVGAEREERRAVLRRVMDRLYDPLVKDDASDIATVAGEIEMELQTENEGRASIL